MRVDITGLDPAEVLLALYNRANYQRLSYNLTRYNFTTAVRASLFIPGSRTLAEQVWDDAQTNNSFHFTGVDLGRGIRALNVTIIDNYFDSTTYDKTHGGPGSAQTVIDRLRLQQAPVSQERNKKKLTELLQNVGSGVLVRARTLHRPLDTPPVITSSGYTLPTGMITKPNQDGQYLDNEDNNTTNNCRSNYTS